MQHTDNLKLVRSSRKSGLPPGSLVHIGEKKVDVPRISVIEYDEKVYSSRELPSFDACAELKDKGTIKWIEAKGSEKGYYDFNLRFNEDKNKPASDVGAAFDQAEGLDAFFAVDTNIPTLTGRITYDDKKDGDTVIESKVTYALDANKLTRQQVMNFAKMWIIASGPANDE